MTYGTHFVIDEASAFFQREPSVLEGMYEALANCKSWTRPSSFDPRTNMYSFGVEVPSREELLREEERRKLKKARENCLHGRRPYPVHWKPGTHPLGLKEFWVNIEGMAGGPYLLSEGDHDILHSLKKEHTHV